MILYNMRYRGPLEYDKFVLNILQFHNEVNVSLLSEVNDSINKSNLPKLKEDIDALYETIVGAEMIGLSEKLHMESLNIRGM